MVATTVRYDENLRSKVIPILDSMGLSLNAYLNLALHQLAIQGKVPFEVYASPSSLLSNMSSFSNYPSMNKVNGKLVAPADWHEDEDE